MKKLKLFFIIFIGSVYTLSAQVDILNTVGVCHLSGDPNTVTDLNSVNQLIECGVVKDTTGANFYLYDPSLTVGTRWILVPTEQPDNSVSNEVNTLFQVNGSNLEITDSAGTLSVPLSSIGVQSVVGSGDIGVTSNNGVYTVDFTETNTSIIFNSVNKRLEFTDENGTTNNIDLSNLDTRLSTATITNGGKTSLNNIDGNNSISIISGQGTSIDIDVTNADEAIYKIELGTLPKYKNNQEAFNALGVGKAYECDWGSTECQRGVQRWTFTP